MLCRLFFSNEKKNVYITKRTPLFFPGGGERGRRDEVVDCLFGSGGEERLEAEVELTATATTHTHPSGDNYIHFGQCVHARRVFFFLLWG
jgi:hypothetical protein